jgi:antitoxin ParD1/3/4
MNISLTPELVQFVQDLVQTGMYHSSSEVIRDGLRLLREREQLRHIRIEELRKELAIGLEQLERGEYTVLNENTLAEIKAEGRRRLARMQLQEGNSDE